MSWESERTSETPAQSPHFFFIGVIGWRFYLPQAPLLEGVHLFMKWSQLPKKIMITSIFHMLYLMAWQLHTPNLPISKSQTCILLYPYLHAVPLAWVIFLTQSFSYKIHEWVNLLSAPFKTVPSIWNSFVTSHYHLTYTWQLEPNMYLAFVKTWILIFRLTLVLFYLSFSCFSSVLVFAPILLFP